MKSGDIIGVMPSGHGSRLQIVGVAGASPGASRHRASTDAAQRAARMTTSPASPSPPPSTSAPARASSSPQHLLEAGCKRPLIVTDRALAALPVMAEFRSHLAPLDAVAVFDGVFGNPTCAQVMDGAKAFKLHGADCVIGFGGGAALDVAKVVGVVATHDGDILEYVWDHPQVRPIVNPLPYMVALPTTSGTGSEVGRSSVVSENDTHHKRTVFSAEDPGRARCSPTPS